MAPLDSLSCKTVNVPVSLDVSLNSDVRQWRVTLISIHPKELVIMPQKDVNKMTSLIQSLLPTYGIAAIELSKKEIKCFSQELLNEE